MQAVTLEVILRAVFGVDRRGAPRAPARAAAGSCSRARPLAGLQFCVLLSRRARRPGSAGAAAGAALAEIDALLAGGDRRAPRRPAGRPSARTSCSLLIARALRGRQPMDDAEIRDQLMTLLLAGHETTATGAGVDVRPAAAPPRRARAAAARRSTHGDDDAYLRAVDRRVAAAAPRRAARRPPADERAARRRPRRCPPAPTSRRRSGSPTRARIATPSPTRSAPSASSTRAPRPTRGSRSAAACAAASAPRSRRWRCASCSPRCCAPRAVRARRPAARRARRPAQRDVLAARRHPHPRRRPLRPIRRAGGG